MIWQIDITLYLRLTIVFVFAIGNAAELRGILEDDITRFFCKLVLIEFDIIHTHKDSSDRLRSTLLYFRHLRGVNLGKIQYGDMSNMRHNFSG